MHHRYYNKNKGLTSVLEDFTNLRVHGASCIGGVNPTPRLKCLIEDHSRRINDRAPIDTATCTKIVIVAGDSVTKYVGGVYGKCPTKKEGRPMWGRYDTPDDRSTNWNQVTKPNCAGSTINGHHAEILWSPGWGWGVISQNSQGLHHRFSECNGGGKTPTGGACNKGDAANTMGQFPHVRGGYASGRAPSVTCVAWK